MVLKNMIKKYKYVLSSFFYDGFCLIVAKSKVYKTFPFNYLLKMYRRGNVLGVYDNLLNIGFCESDAKYFSERESYMKILRDINSYAYDIKNAKKLKHTIDFFPITKGLDIIKSGVSDEKSIICVLHCGFYWETVAKIVTLDNEKEFVIPILDLKHDLTRRSITALNLVCKNLDVIDIQDRKKAAIKIIKAVRNGKKLIIFSDLPPSIGNVVFGAPGCGKFMNKNANIANGPVEIAKTLNMDIIYVSSDPDLKQSIHNIVVLNKLDQADVSVQNNMNVMEDFIRKKPYLWAYMDRIENYFQWNNGCK